MNSSTDTSAAPSSGAAATPAPAPASGRLTLLLIAGIPVIMILASTWMWYFVVNGNLDLVGALGTANAGELVQPPRQLFQAGLRDSNDAPYDASRRRGGTWTLVIPQRSAACDSACEARLFETRQIHQLLGKEMGRVRRAMVSPSRDVSLTAEALTDGRPLPSDFQSYLTREQRGLAVLHGDADAIAGLFPELETAPESWYLMDPAGWVMMRYDASVGYKDVISDLKFLIKNSSG
ncbi:MAG: hypothetical protein AAFY29_15000 [Pseudomonadota bacterium]